MEPYFVDDTFGGHIVYADHVEPADPFSSSIVFALRHYSIWKRMLGG